jgi:hypothetical protein
MFHHPHNLMSTISDRQTVRINSHRPIPIFLDLCHFSLHNNTSSVQRIWPRIWKQLLRQRGLTESQWSRGLRQVSAAASFLDLPVRIPSWAWMSVSFYYCVLSGTELCVGPITRPEESPDFSVSVISILQQWDGLGPLGLPSHDKKQRKCEQIFNDTVYNSDYISTGARDGAVVEALRYKPEGCGIDSRWCDWNFSLT